MRTHLRRVNPRVEGAIGLFLILLGLLLFLLFFTSCTRFRGAFGKAQKKTEIAGRAVDRDTQQFATAVVDVLSLVDLPTNSLPDLRNAMSIGLRYARFTQRGLGLPVQRIDVEGEVRGEKKAVEAARKVEAASAVHLETEATTSREEIERLKRLAELGAQYEKEKNQNIVKRVWKWSISTFGIGGLIALCVFFPFLIPIFGRIVAWVVSKIPALAGFIGVVGTKVADGLIAGVQKTNTDDSVSPAVKKKLRSNLEAKKDSEDSALIDSRREVVAERLRKQEAESAKLKSLEESAAVEPDLEPEADITKK